ncbi:MAG: hypothetical protein HYX48_06460 [Chlamydiales bacterium]|nr:hypothetical protein [Chlamydiales bacterium]
MKKFLLSLLFVTTTLSASAEEIDLSLYERSFFSQNGEDGVLAKLFQLIKPNSRFCVELGAYDGITGSNTYLLRRQGWDCLLIDRTFEIPEYKQRKEFITAENINDLMRKYGVPFDLDLISIDIDYNDFYIWNALDEHYRPAVVVIEYNGYHLPDQDKIVKYRPFFTGGGDNYFGASILALYNLGRSKGYSLVYAESAGVNLFFVRDDILEEKNLFFKNVNDVEKLYRKPTYGNGPNGGHRQDQKNREYVPSTKFIK